MADEFTHEQIRYKRHDIVISSLDAGDVGLFKNRGYIRTVVICEGVTELPDELFCGCTNLRSVTLPESLVRIGSRAFERTFALKTLELPEGLKEIATAAFFESGITGVSIPKGITEIPERAFQGCKALESAELPQSLEYIGCKAFKDCFNSKRELLKLKKALETAARITERNRKRYAKKLDDCIKKCERVYKLLPDDPDE